MRKKGFHYKLLSISKLSWACAFVALLFLPLLCLDHPTSVEPLHQENNVHIQEQLAHIFSTHDECVQPTSVVLTNRQDIKKFLSASVFVSSLKSNSNIWDRSLAFGAKPISPILVYFPAYLTLRC